jgi:predicted RNA-binding Zn-ribbon protein involved in translation (DUF1610 family)
MPEFLDKCTVCGALVDEEDLFCANCGTETPKRESAANSQPDAMQTHTFVCTGCGASMSYDASAQTLRCPFCGSEKLEDEKEVKSLSPHRVVPFRVERSAAESALRQWLGRGFWRPSDLSETAALTKVTPVYVPYWIFRARTHTHWTADSSHTPAGARGDWYPLAGEHQGEYPGLLIGASSVLTPDETTAICPFDLGASVPPDEVELNNVTVEQFRVQRKYARSQARQAVEQLERDACTRYVPGRCRNLKVNVRIEGQSSEPALLPVWVMAYRYKEQLYRFLLNGQTGRATGQAPFSWKKLAVVLAIAGAFLAVILLIALLASAGG